MTPARRTHPELTVVVNFYNLQRLAPQALASLRGSASPGVRFLLVDDASTDDTPNLLEDAARSIPGADVLHLDHNQGLAAARHRGMERVETDWFTFLDGDDWVEPGYYPTLFDEVLASGCEWVRTDHIEVVGTTRTPIRIPDRNRAKRIGSPRESILAARTTSVDFAHAWSGVYHRRLRDEGLVFYPEQLRTAEDRPGIWRLHLNVDRFTIARTMGLFYRRGVAGSLTQTGDVRQLAIIESLRLMREEVLADREADRFMPKVVRTWCGLLAAHWMLRSRLTPALRRRFAVEALHLLDTVDPAMLQANLDTMIESRRQALEDLLRTGYLWEAVR
ncbi:glycosyltransferase family 2 protein [Mariniluteicoccus endophyticus]